MLNIIGLPPGKGVKSRGKNFKNFHFKIKLYDNIAKVLVFPNDLFLYERDFGQFWPVCPEGLKVKPFASLV